MLDPQVVETLRSEIEACEAECKHPILFPGYLPSRLLFIGTDCQGKYRLRLETREEAIANANWARQTDLTRYAALSYCWGPPEDALKQIKTESRFLEDWSRNIPKDSLSPVVRDAVEMARKLGIRYLWIDSMCINQDDRKEWERESPLMGPVYSNAYVTFIPLNSATCQEGFLDRTPLAAALTPDDATPGPSLSLSTDWRAAAWSRRGWTFQEEKLTTRAIYFGPSRFYFCCSNWIRADDVPERGLVLEPSLLERARNPRPGEDASDTLMRFWEENLVRQFTHRAFTRPSDKLQAIASLAKYIGDFTGYEYSAGLWVQRLCTQLGWYYKPPAGASLDELIGAIRSSSTKDYIAPSWSWARFATIDGVRFYFGGQRVQLEAKIEPPRIEAVGPNRYGQIQSGTLRLTTKILNISAAEDIRDRTWRGGDEVFLLDWSTGFDPSTELRLVVIGSYPKMRKVGSRAQVAHKRVYGIVGYAADADGTLYRVGIFDCAVLPGKRFQDLERMNPHNVVIM